MNKPAFPEPEDDRPAYPHQPRGSAGSSDPSYYFNTGYGDHEPATGGMLSGLTPRQILRAVIRRWWLLALAIGFGLSLAALYLHRAEPIFSAEAVLEMSIRRPRIMAQPGAMIDDGFAGWRVDELLNTRIRKLHGQETRTLARQMLAEDPHLSGHEAEQVDAALGAARMSRHRDSHLVSVSVDHPDPRIAALTANQYARAVLRRSFEENRNESDRAVAWLQQQAAHQAVVLENAESALLSFRAEQHMDQLENEKRILHDSVISLSDELTQIEKQRVMANEILTMLDLANAQPEYFGNLPETMPYHREILSSVSQWHEARKDLENLSARLTDRHPEYVNQQRLLSAARDRVTESIERARETAQANIHLYDQQTRTLRERIRTQSEAATVTETKLAQLRTSLSALERTRDSADASFKGLLTRIEEARLAADENTSIIHLIEEAGPSQTPVYPRRNRALMLGLFGGGVLGFLMVLGIYMLEDGIEGTEAIERQLGIKVIGLIPHENIQDPSALCKIALSKEYHPMVEAFANVRAMLESDTFRAHAQCILVTSTAPREGKTSTASNLAISFARAGHRTCLIGFDLRQPRARPIFGIPDAHPSMARALGPNAVVRFEDLPYKIPDVPLWVISTRHGRETTASEMLGGQSVKAILDWAMNHYDRVVIDSPPYSLIGDALVLASYATGVLLVCRPSVTRMRALRHVGRDFSEAGARIIGVLVNDIEFKRSSYFSNYHYYDHHAYRYADPYPVDAREETLQETAR